MARQETTALRRGWTTGACAAAASRAAFQALLTGKFPNPVAIRLPRGQAPIFPLALAEQSDGRARAGVVKDAGDDPDVTHGALIVAELAWASPGSGIQFRAGEGVGTVTRPGLALAVGEPAINPAPRAIIAETLTELAEANGASSPDLEVTIAIPGGALLAEKTMNARLGILGGLSVLGTTGIVVPYSCSSWIHAIQRGIDVARAAGFAHIAAATGSTSERAVQRLYDLPEAALIDMGDFVGGTLKYLRRHPVPRLTLAGGFAKLAKLAQGHLDLHSSRSRLDAAALADILAGLGTDPATVAAAAAASSAGAILELAGDRRAAGLAAFMMGQEIDRLIDATHPFAAEISRAARLAASRTGIPRLSLRRPPWQRHPLDRWIEVDSLEAAALLVGRIGRRAWLTVGANSIAAFAPATGVRFVVRLIDSPREPLPLRFYEVVTGRGPFSLAEERHLMERHAIDVLVCKATGGARSEERRVGKECRSRWSPYQ